MLRYGFAKFDPKVNSYVKLSEGKVSVSEPLADNLIIDLDKDGQAVGIECFYENMRSSKRK